MQSLLRPEDAGLNSDIEQLISSTAERYGIDPKSFLRMGQIESRLDPNAKSPLSSASGLFQFTKGTAKDYGLSDPFDASANTDAAARLWKDNEAGLRKALGRDPTPGELYLAHQQGLGGASKLLSDPDAKAVDVVGRKAVLNNGGSEDMTAAEFAQKWIGKFEGEGAPVTVASADAPASFLIRPAPGVQAKPKRGIAAPAALPMASMPELDTRLESILQ